MNVLYCNVDICRLHCSNNFFLVVPAIVESLCGDPPVIPNGKLTRGGLATQEGSTVAVTCDEGFLAHVRNFVCESGEWNSRGTPLPEVCKRESCVSQLPVTHTNGLQGSRPSMCFCLPTADPTYCGTPPRVENAVVITPAKLFPPNSQVTYQCRSNFNQEGNSRSVCNNGQWDVRLTCTRMYESLSCSFVHLMQFENVSQNVLRS